uniref:Uncharacterized protein AlNc14C155G7622 n=1 Tax=Albugo laibachii Nc14 TaxID=890382 RepID=F0WMB7_9STRA|nr:conserved hypothetical protein [Albugo laibachii Nc14]|eukprot:CCA22448.1 conserved hypothetical protein [Albugo laibachii Nc14]
MIIDSDLCKSGILKSEEMENIKRGKLKLKRGKLAKVTASKKGYKTKKNDIQDSVIENNKVGSDDSEIQYKGMTQAQIKHEEIQRKRENDEINKIASKTYRQRVDELNQYLGSLTEHHDIPRVSAAGNG